MSKKSFVIARLILIAVFAVLVVLLLEANFTGRVTGKSIQLVLLTLAFYFFYAI